MKYYKYQGAGNDFLLADNRCGEYTSVVTPAYVARICDRRYGFGADGLMLLEDAEGYDFKMVYYNSDGSGGMMCGNGGRCIVAFAYLLGLRSFHFLAADGLHTASIVERNNDTSLIVRLKMKDVDAIERYDTPELQGCFLDTGTRHFVAPVQGIEAYDVDTQGRRIRHRSEFAPIGVNANFIEQRAEVLWVRTFEKGVEAETYACGTGITAAAIAAWHMAPGQKTYGEPVEVKIRALHDELKVDFVPTPEGATDVYLTGPAQAVGIVEAWMR